MHLETGMQQTSDHWLCSISSLMQIGAKTQEERLPEVNRIHVHTTQTYSTRTVPAAVLLFILVDLR